MANEVRVIFMSMIANRVDIIIAIKITILKKVENMRMT